MGHIETKWIDTHKAFEEELMQTRSRLVARGVHSWRQARLVHGALLVESLITILSNGSESLAGRGHGATWFLSRLENTGRMLPDVCISVKIELTLHSMSMNCARKWQGRPTNYCESEESTLGTGVQIWTSKHRSIDVHGFRLGTTKDIERSTTAGMSMMGDHMVDANSSRHKIRARSRAEAELCAAALGSPEPQGNRADDEEQGF